MSYNASEERLELERTCRTCACNIRQQKRFALFTKAEDGFEGIKPIFHELSLLKLNILPNDGLPQQVCCRCSSVLGGIQAFCRQVNRSQLILGQQFKKENNTFLSQIKKQPSAPPLTKNEPSITTIPPKKSDTATFEFCKIEPIENEPNEFLEESNKSITISDSEDSDSNGLGNVADKKVDHLQSSDTTHYCDSCDKYYPHRKSWLQHQRRNHQLSSHTCPHCQKFFNKSYYFNQHLRRHENEKKCGTLFPRLLDVNKREDGEHFERSFQCFVCHVEFKDERSTKNHIRNHPSTGHCCRECHKEFPHRRSMQQHYNRIHRKCLKNCPHCNRLFTNPHYFRRHFNSCKLLNGE